MRIYNLSLLSGILIMTSFMLYTEEIYSKEEKMEYESEEIPAYLYKILSVKNWQESQNEKNVVLPPEDDNFIHLSKEEQLENIITKYWGNVSQFVIVKVDTSKLSGKLVYEANPGGTSKYYHLYNGNIPLDSIIEAKVIQRSPV